MNYNYMPTAYKSLKTDKSYWKPSEMSEGDNKFRIVMQPIAGWIDWIEKKPKRYRPDEKPANAYDPDKPIKPFWSLYVWDYVRQGLFILEITQMSIIKSLVALGTDEDWGDFTKYDLKINKTGQDLKTRYVLTALPHKELSQTVKDAMEESPVCLDALYDGGDPWTDFAGPKVHVLPVQERKEREEEFEGLKQVPLLSNAYDTLKEYVAVQGIDDEYLEEFIDMACSKANVNRSVMVDNILKTKEMTDRFIMKYSRHLEQLSA